MRISDWSSDVCSSDLLVAHRVTTHDDPTYLQRVELLESFADSRVLDQPQSGSRQGSNGPGGGLTIYRTEEFVQPGEGVVSPAGPSDLHQRGAVSSGSRLSAQRSDERRVGQACVMKGKFRGAP